MTPCLLAQSLLITGLRPRSGQGPSSGLEAPWGQGTGFAPRVQAILGADVAGDRHVLVVSRLCRVQPSALILSKYFLPL